MKTEKTTEATSSSEETAAAPEAPAHKADAIVDDWFAKYFHDLGPKLDVEIHNFLHAAKEDLKKILHAL